MRSDRARRPAGGRADRGDARLAPGRQDGRCARPPGLAEANTGAGRADAEGRSKVKLASYRAAEGDSAAGLVVDGRGNRPRAGRAAARRGPAVRPAGDPGPGAGGMASLGGWQRCRSAGGDAAGGAYAWPRAAAPAEDPAAGRQLPVAYHRKAAPPVNKAEITPRFFLKPGTAVIGTGEAIRTSADLGGDRLRGRGRGGHRPGRTGHR